VRSTAALAKEVELLKARTATARKLRIPADRTEFARLLGIEPDDWQAEFLSSDARRVLMNCSRQSGKSTVAAVRALHEALYKPGSLTLILAPAERQAQELFAKVSGFYRQLGHAPSPDSDRKGGMALSNGSRIEALPGSNERTIRGFSGVGLLIVDEAARVLDELYYALRPMLAVSGGTLMMLSTPYGKRGVFYEEWLGPSSSSSWERYEIPATECPRISPEFLAEERATLPLRVFRQEYLCSFEEAEGRVFSETAIQAAITEDIEPLDFAEEEEVAS
jgi:phage FluMu gp28-like protein